MAETKPKKQANQDWTVRIIGFPMDLGAGRRGVDMGPSALRIAGVGEKLSALGYNVIDAGDIPITNPEIAEVQDPKLRYLHEIASACSDLASEVEKSLDRDESPIVLG